MMANRKDTSKKIASLAAKTLTDENSSAIAKRLAGSALSQSDKGKQTGPELEDIASKVLKSEKYSDDTKKLAGSILSQSNKER
jgi:cytochrome c551/c552